MREKIKNLKIEEISPFRPAKRWRFNVILLPQGVDKMGGRPSRPWPTLWPTLWHIGGQTFKNINTTLVRVERVPWHKLLSIKQGYPKSHWHDFQSHREQNNANLTALSLKQSIFLCLQRILQPTLDHNSRLCERERPIMPYCNEGHDVLDDFWNQGSRLTFQLASPVACDKFAFTSQNKSFASQIL